MGAAISSVTLIPAALASGAASAYSAYESTRDKDKARDVSIINACVMIALAILCLFMIIFIPL